MNRFAAIDIGTNTLLMVVGEQTVHGIQIVRDEHAIARLGEGVDAEGNITEAAILRAEQILHTYRTLCRELQVDTIKAVATSAMRDAGNREDVRSRLTHALGVAIDIISGEEEASLSFLGTVETGDLCTVIDIGGGSTEYITGGQRSILQRTSLQMGAVRFTERFFTSLPPPASAVESARREIQTLLSHLEKEHRGILIGVGGTFTTLAAMALGQEFQSDVIHGYRLQQKDVIRLSEYVLTHSLTELCANAAIHPRRADILPMGVLIAEESLRYFHKEECVVSVKGLRYGVLIDAISSHQ